MYKQRLSPNGSPISQAERHILEASPQKPADANNSSRNATTSCGTCYGAEDPEHPCCNTCDEVCGIAAAGMHHGATLLKHFSLSHSFIASGPGMLPVLKASHAGKSCGPRCTCS